MSDLICGYNSWPTAIGKDGRQAAVPEMTVEDVQIGGIFCNHELLFGLRFEIPDHDPLALLIESYQFTCLPGRKAEGYSTPLEDILTLRQRLAELRLEIDPVYYAHFAEAYVPLAFPSAVAYALERRFPLSYDSKNGKVTLEAKELGLVCADDIERFVARAWTETEEQVYQQAWQISPPDHLFGVGIGVNSD